MLLGDVSSIENTYNSKHTLTVLSLLSSTRRVDGIRRQIWRQIENMLSINEDISAGKNTCHFFAVIISLSTEYARLSQYTVVSIDQLLN